jgi:3-phosphoglycerate kinase
MKMTPENMDYEDCRPVRDVKGGAMTEEFRQKILAQVAAAREAISQEASVVLMQHRSHPKRRTHKP